jgi:hypothetical protein
MRWLQVHTSTRVLRAPIAALGVCPFAPFLLCAAGGLYRMLLPGLPPNGEASAAAAARGEWLYVRPPAWREHSDLDTLSSTLLAEG